MVKKKINVLHEFNLKFIDQFLKAGGAAKIGELMTYKQGALVSLICVTNSLIPITNSWVDKSFAVCKYKKLVDLLRIDKFKVKTR